MFYCRFDEKGRPVAIFRVVGLAIEQLDQSGEWAPCGHPEDAAELVKVNSDELRLCALILDIDGLVVAA